MGVARNRTSLRNRRAGEGKGGEGGWKGRTRKWLLKISDACFLFLTSASSAFFNAKSPPPPRYSRSLAEFLSTSLWGRIGPLGCKSNWKDPALVVLLLVCHAVISFFLFDFSSPLDPSTSLLDSWPPFRRERAFVPWISMFFPSFFTAI